eukprot:gene5350-6492_t
MAFVLEDAHVHAATPSVAKAKAKNFPECLGSTPFKSGEMTLTQDAFSGFDPFSDGHSKQSSTKGLTESDKSMIPETNVVSEYEFRPAASCVLIGSNDALKGKNLGSQIDKYNIIMRLNKASSKGLEQDVGSLTTIRLTSFNNAVYREPDDGAVVSTWCHRPPCKKQELLKLLGTKNIPDSGWRPTALGNKQLGKNAKEKRRVELLKQLGLFEHAEVPSLEYTGAVMLMHMCQKVKLLGVALTPSADAAGTFSKGKEVPGSGAKGGENRIREMKPATSKKAAVSSEEEASFTPMTTAERNVAPAPLAAGMGAGVPLRAAPKKGSPARAAVLGQKWSKSPSHANSYNGRRRLLGGNLGRKLLVAKGKSTTEGKYESKCLFQMQANDLLVSEAMPTLSTKLQKKRPEYSSEQAQSEPAAEETAEQAEVEETEVQAEVEERAEQEEVPEEQAEVLTEASFTMSKGKKAGAGKATMVKKTATAKKPVEKASSKKTLPSLHQQAAAQAKDGVTAPPQVYEVRNMLHMDAPQALANEDSTAEGTEGEEGEEGEGMPAHKQHHESLAEQAEKKRLKKANKLLGIPKVSEPSSEDGQALTSANPAK